MKKIILLSIVLLFSFASSFAQSRYISQTTKKVVYSRDGGICQCCSSYQNLEYDHITPYSCGGSNEASNIQLLCRKCNRSKSNSCYCKVHHKKVGIDCCEGKTTITKQFSGTKKKGTRCKNRTKNPSGRCHHHQ